MFKGTTAARTTEAKERATSTTAVVLATRFVKGILGYTCQELTRPLSQLLSETEEGSMLAPENVYPRIPCAFDKSNSIVYNGGFRGSPFGYSERLPVASAVLVVVVPPLSLASLLVGSSLHPSQACNQPS